MHTFFNCVLCLQSTLQVTGSAEKLFFLAVRCEIGIVMSCIETLQAFAVAHCTAAGNLQSALPQSEWGLASVKCVLHCTSIYNPTVVLLPWFLIAETTSLWWCVKWCTTVHVFHRTKCFVLFSPSTVLYYFVSMVGVWQREWCEREVDGRWRDFYRCGRYASHVLTQIMVSRVRARTAARPRTVQSYHHFPSMAGLDHGRSGGFLLAAVRKPFCT